MQLFTLGFVGLLLLIATPPILAQSANGSCCGPVGEYVRAAELTLSDGEGEMKRERLQAIVLWRADRQMRTTYWEDIARSERALQEARRASEKGGRQLIGGFHAGGFHIAEVSNDRRTLWVLGRAFELPMRDSALVILIDHVDGVGGTPTLSGQVYIPAEVPADYTGHLLKRGDTTLMVPGKNRELVFLRTLRRSPVVSAFIGDIKQR